MPADLTLDVTLYGTPIGELTRGPSGKASFEWSREGEARWKLRATPLSHSLPVGTTSSHATESFFGALLPEGRWLDQLSNALHVASNDIVGLLSEVGADLAGALVVGSARETLEPMRVGTDEMQQLLARAAGFMLGGGGSALAGFQRKLTLTRLDGHWVNGNGAIASSHIIKPVAEDNRDLIEGENYVLTLARSLGLLNFESWTEMIGSTPVLVIERYDRKRTSAGIERIHQEDLSQALGLPWGGDDKFERNNAGANLRAIAAVLDRDRTIFDEGEPDREKLLKYTVLNVAAGNTDAHAKNFSMLRPAHGAATLAPFYDASPLALGFEAPLDLAMTIGGERFVTKITVDHLTDEAQSWGLEPRRAREVIEETLSRIIDGTQVIEAHDSIAAHVPGYIRGQARNLAAGRPARLDTPIPPILMRKLGSSD
ncbi:type II toxin-antitoxin system HipA family toxin [Subtercola frigoramans]